MHGTSHKSFAPTCVGSMHGTSGTRPVSVTCKSWLAMWKVSSGTHATEGDTPTVLSACGHKETEVDTEGQ
jgi:hypothetical protein